MDELAFWEAALVMQFLSLGLLSLNLLLHVSFFDFRVLNSYSHLFQGVELEVDLLKQKSAEYARAKELAIRAARDMVDVENIKHITENQTLIGDVVEKTAEDWKAQKELFYQQTGIDIVKEVQEKSSPNNKWLKSRMAMKTSVRN